MSRTYEFLEDRMSYLNKDALSKYYEMKMQYQFMPKASDIPTLEKYIIKEEVENVAMWLTHMNILELDWKQAIDKLHKIAKKQSK